MKTYSVEIRRTDAFEVKVEAENQDKAHDLAM